MCIVGFPNQDQITQQMQEHRFRQQYANCTNIGLRQSVSALVNTLNAPTQFKVINGKTKEMNILERIVAKILVALGVDITTERVKQVVAPMMHFLETYEVRKEKYARARAEEQSLSGTYAYKVNIRKHHKDEFNKVYKPLLEAAQADMRAAQTAFDYEKKSMSTSFTIARCSTNCVALKEKKITLQNAIKHLNEIELLRKQSPEEIRKTNVVDEPTRDGLAFAKQATLDCIANEKRALNNFNRAKQEVKDAESQLLIDMQTMGAQIIGGLTPDQQQRLRAILGASGAALSQALGLTERH